MDRPSHMTKIYIIDDDIQVAELLVTAIRGFGLQAESFNNAYDFLGVKLNVEDIILLDLNMPDMDGIEVIRKLASSCCSARLILISGHDLGVLHSAEQLAQAHSLKVVAGLTKPISIAQLKELILRLVQEMPDSIILKEGRYLSPDITELVSAIENDQFVLHYQPQIEVATGRVSGAEALVRWIHPERGIVYPEDFISLAEKNHLMGSLTELILVRVLHQQKTWKKNGIVVPVSVNISADNIRGLSLPENLMEIIQTNELDAHCITLEITESALMDELVTSLDILTRLRIKGFKLSIDDFGTGYSSLSQLHRIPFTEMKVDKSFVMSMGYDVESRAIVKTCVMLGHELSMSVVAEGVESGEILDMLKSLGCDYAQGYHISSPLPEDEFLEWYQKNNSDKLTVAG